MDMSYCESYYKQGFELSSLAATSLLVANKVSSEVLFVLKNDTSMPGCMSLQAESVSTKRQLFRSIMML